MIFLETILGALLAIGVLAFYREFSGVAFKKFFARTLVLAALIYVGFSLAGLISGSASFNWLLVELLGVAIYFSFASLGLKKSVAFLGVGWILHIAWDVGLHFSESVMFVPGFYPGICIGFDLVFGIFVIYKFFTGIKE